VASSGARCVGRRESEENARLHLGSGCSPLGAKTGKRRWSWRGCAVAQVRRAVVRDEWAGESHGRLHGTRRAAAHRSVQRLGDEGVAGGDAPLHRWRNGGGAAERPEGRRAVYRRGGHGTAKAGEDSAGADLRNVVMF